MEEGEEDNARKNQFEVLSVLTHASIRIQTLNEEKIKEFTEGLCVGSSWVVW